MPTVDSLCALGRFPEAVELARQEAVDSDTVAPEYVAHTCWNCPACFPDEAEASS